MNLILHCIILLYMIYIYIYTKFPFEGGQNLWKQPLGTLGFVNPWPTEEPRQVEVIETGHLQDVEEAGEQAHRLS